MRDSKSGLFAALVLLLLLMFSCTDSADDPLGSGQGRLTVDVHDQAASGIAEAWVTFAAVQAVRAGGGFEDVAGVALGTPINLATLINGNSVTLASGSLPAGDYTGVWLSIAALTLVLDDGSSVDPLSPATGVAAQVPISFTVEEGQDTVLSIDFPLSAFAFDGTNWTFDPSQVAAD